MQTPRTTLTLLRHGATEWSEAGRHTGRTDLELTDEGRAEAKAVAPALAAGSWDLALVSPLQRARETAELAGVTGYELESDLREWDYGDFEGLTTEQIHRSHPDWDIWRGPWPHGETADQVAARVDGVIARALDAGPGAQVLLVAHGHVLRALAARWLGQPVAAGRLLALDTATLSELGWEHANRVVRRWNVPAAT